MKHIVAIALIVVYASIWYGVIFIPLSPLRSGFCMLTSFPILILINNFYVDK